MRYTELEIQTWSEESDTIELQEILNQTALAEPALASIDYDSFMANRKSKNSQTYYGYTKVVRIMRRIRENMMAENLIDGSIITPFLIECVTWYTPNGMIIGSRTWNALIRNLLTYIRDAQKTEACKEWKDVSQTYPLFSENINSWLLQDLTEFIEKAMVFMGYTV